MSDQVFQYVGAGSVIGLVTLCITLVRNVNGRLNSFTEKNVCDERHDSVNLQFSEVNKKLDIIQEDIKELLGRNNN